MGEEQRYTIDGRALVKRRRALASGIEGEGAPEGDPTPPEPLTTQAIPSHCARASIRSGFTEPELGLRSRDPQDIAVGDGDGNDVAEYCMSTPADIGTNLHEGEILPAARASVRLRRVG